jgi:hypothetical protein
VYPPLKIFAKLVNKNAIKPQKGVPSLKNFHNPLYTLPPKIWQKPHRPSPWIFQLCATMLIVVKRDLRHKKSLLKKIFDLGAKVGKY